MDGDEIARDGRRVSVAILVAACLISVWQIVSPDRIPVASGMGWDGSIYGAFAQDFPARYRDGVSSYYLGRLLPSLLVYKTLLWSGIDRSAENVVLAFRLLNAVLTMGAAIIWVRISRMMNLRATGASIGFAGLFLNFFSLKMAPYYPVLTDVPAWFLSLAMFHAHLRRSFWALLMLTAIGRFVWPTAMVVGATLLLFPREAIATEGRWARSVGLAAVCVVTTAFGFFTINLLTRNQRIWPAIAELNRPVWPLSVFLVLILLFFSLQPIARLSLAGDQARWWHDFCRWQTFVTLAWVGVLTFVASRLVTKPGTVMTLGIVLRLTAWTSVTLPLKALVAHIMYYGPVVVLAVWKWKSVVDAAASFGRGPVLCLGVLAVLGLNSESRYLANLWPLAVPCIAKVWDDPNLPRKNLMAILAVCMFTSKVWLLIGDPSGDIEGFPAQLYFSNQGPWMSATMYLVQTIAVGFTCAVLFALLRKPTAILAPAVSSSSATVKLH